MPFRSVTEDQGACCKIFGRECPDEQPPAGFELTSANSCVSDLEVELLLEGRGSQRAMMLTTRLRFAVRVASGTLSHVRTPTLCPCQDAVASTSDSARVGPTEGFRSYSGTAPLFMRAGGRLDVSAVAAAIEEADGLASIRSEDLVVNRTTTPKPKPALSELLFGRVCTDHMLQASWNMNTGWSAPSIDPLAPLQLHPAAQVLHYGIECFEGMKAYMGVDGRIRMFRPDKNMDRLARSAQRLNLPDFDKVEYLECIKELLRVERDWLPDKEGYSLYLRPTYIATTPTLGIAPPAAALLYTIISPVGPYFPTGVKPIKLFVDTRHARAWPGGVGDCKVGGNYASTIRPQVQAAALGCQQVLYVLDNGPEGDGIVGESGAMNVFFLWRRKDGKKELVTPPLDGMILPGVTRDTVLSLVRGWSDFEVAERPIRWREIEAAVAENRMLEMFGTGTAVIIQPITTLLKSDGTALTVPFDSAETSRWIDRKPGTTYGAQKEPTTSLAGRLMRTIMDVQYGHTDSPWSVPVS